MHFRRLWLALLFSTSATSVAGVNTWTITGPEGGAAAAVAFDPHVAGVAFAAVGHSIYRSADSAQTWTEVYPGISASPGRIVVDPSNPNRVMVSTSTVLYRSDDGGFSFGAANAPGSVTRLAIASDGNALYAGTLEGKVFRSGDFGALWQDRSAGLPAGHLIVDLVVDPNRATTLYAVVEPEGLYRSFDDGVSWTPVSLGAHQNTTAKKIAVDPGDASYLLLATLEGLLVSEDAGASWAVSQTGAFAWVGFSPTEPGAAVAIPWIGSVIYRADRNSLWQQGQDVKLAGVEDAAFDPHDVENGTLLVATTEGPLLSQDGGATFSAHSQGLRGSTVGALAAANDVDGTIYVAYTSGPVGVYRRTSLGWVDAGNADLKARLINPFNPTSLAVNPQRADSLLVASGDELFQSADWGETWSGPHPAFAFKPLHVISYAPSGQAIFIGTDENGLYESENQGATWFPVAGNAPDAIGALAVDPFDADTLYAAVKTAMAPPILLKSTDGGSQFEPADTGLDVDWIESIAIDPSNPEHVFVGGIGNGSGVFESADAGTSWTRVGAPIGNQPGFSIAVDPVVPTNVFMAYNASEGGAARSVDGGETWEALPFDWSVAAPLHELFLDPAKPYNVIAAAQNVGLIELEISPDLELNLTSVPTTLALEGAGDAFVEVRNLGPFAASDVKLIATMPEGATAETATAPQGPCSTHGALLECQLGALRVNQSVEVTVTMRGGDTPQLGTLSATVTAHEPDSAFANNTDAATVATDRIADVSVTLTSNEPAVDRESPLHLTAVVGNAGPNASTGETELVVELGAGFVYAGATASQGACAESGGTITCVVGSIEPGAQASVEVAVVASSAGTLTTHARITGTGIDPNAGNDSATTMITSRPVANLGVALTDNPDPVISGREVRYEAVVTNRGPDDALGATVAIALSGATVAGASSAQGSCSTGGSSVTCSLGALVTDATATIIVNATAGAAGTASATANVAFTGTDTEAADDTASQTTTVDSAPTGGGGGGGGAGGWFELFSLLALLGYSAKARLGRRGIGAALPHL